MIVIHEYFLENDKSPFAEWFADLDVQAAAKVNTYLSRIQVGNFSKVEGVGGSVYECKIDFGPGYRVYFGKDGDEFVILLGGGTKKRQQHDIEYAQRLWQEYKQHKRSKLWH